jgi:LDH2 family malate/lactate/ureidoglycolate dehydrogenase
MSDAKSGPVLVSAQALHDFIAAVFRRAGMGEEHAAVVADALVWANLRGVDTHGVTRLPRYVELIETGDMNARAKPRVNKETAAAVLIDCDRAAGPVAMTEAMAAATRKARDAGIGLALVRATTHTAALGNYTLAAAREGMAAIALAASWPNMAYHGARTAGVSTSPISIAVPGGEAAPLLLDMSTGVVSVGKLTQARRAGAPIPEGWALDRDGNPTTDSQAAALPLPMAGPKGSGLALMIECLTSIITSNPLVSEFLEETAEGLRHRQNGLAIAIDIARFCDLASFRREIDRLVQTLKFLPLADGVEEILVPGERGERTFRKRSDNGIPIPQAVFKELQTLAERLGVPMFASSAGVSSAEKA